MFHQEYTVQCWIRFHKYYSQDQCSPCQLSAIPEISNIYSFEGHESHLDTLSTWKMIDEASEAHTVIAGNLMLDTCDLSFGSVDTLMKTSLLRNLSMAGFPNSRTNIITRRIVKINLIAFLFVTTKHE